MLRCVHVLPFLAGMCLEMTNNVTPLRSCFVITCNTKNNKLYFIKYVVCMNDKNGMCYSSVYK